MLKLGFDSKRVHWIMEYVSFVSYNIVVNDKKSNTIFPSGGIRQGDPLSPYLFLFVIDVLSRYINIASESGTVKGPRVIRNCSYLTHILFADDSLFFL